MVAGFWRRIYWRNHARGDQALLGVMVADNLGNIALRTLPDLSRAAAFSGVPEDELRESVDGIFLMLQDGDPLLRYSVTSHPMSSVQIGEPLYSLVDEIRTVERAADSMVRDLVR